MIMSTNSFEIIWPQESVRFDSSDTEASVIAVNPYDEHQIDNNAVIDALAVPGMIVVGGVLASLAWNGAHKPSNK
jgi:hypothetical protein